MTTAPEPAARAGGLVSRLLLVLVCYYACAWSCIRWLSPPDSPLALVWLPSGVGLAALLLGGRRLWPAIWLGSFLANGPSLHDEAASLPLLRAALYGGLAGALDTLQVLVAWALHRRLVGDDLFGDVTRISRFVLVVVPVPAFAFVGALVLLYSAGGYLPTVGHTELPREVETWLAVSLADAHGLLVVTPLALAWLRPAPLLAGRAGLESRWLQAGAGVLLLTGGVLLVSGAHIYLLALGIVLAALRHGGRGASAALALTSLALTSLVAAGVGPHVGSTWPALLTISMFVFVAGFVGLVVAAQQEEIGAANRSLETAVAARTRELQAANERLDRLAQAERRRSESLAEVGLTAAGLAHETKNPLGIIVGLAHQVAHAPDVPAEHATRAEQIIDAAERASSRLGEFIHYTRLRTPTPTSVPLPPLVHATLEVLQAEAEAAGVRFEQDIRIGAVMADEEMLRQILLNLALNALQACDAGDLIELRAGRTADGSAWLEVADTGRGIEPALLPRIFEPYTTGRAAGHGMGLAIVHRLVELHGWTIAVESETDRGARFRITGLEPVVPDGQTAPAGR